MKMQVCRRHEQITIFIKHKKIFILPQETAVYPGHGPNTNVGEELANNPYLWL